MNNFGYKIIEIYDFSNIICINKELKEKLDINDVSIEELYKQQYINNHNRFNCLPWNENVNYWLEIKDKEVLKNEIINYFSTNNNRSKFEIKTKIFNKDFKVDYL